MPGSTALDWDRDHALEDHSTRLRIVERDYAQVSAQLGAQTVQIDQLDKRVDEVGFRLDKRIDEVGCRIDDMGSRMEHGMSELGRHLEGFAKPLVDQVRALGDQAKEHGAKLEAVIAAEGERSRSKTARRKVIRAKLWWAVAAVLGAVGGEAGKWMWASWLASPTP
jgi:hypothetical protein